MGCTTLRDVHLFVANFQGMTTPWEVTSGGRFRSLRLGLTFLQCIWLESRHSRDAQLFQIFLESVSASLCSLSSVLGGLLPFQCVLTVWLPAGFLFRKPLNF